MRRVRQWVVTGLFLGLNLLSATPASALSLGDLVVHSRPGQPLRAIIPIRLEEGEVLSQIHATLASAEEYAAQQQARPPVLEGMRFALLAWGEGRARLQIYGEQPWQGEEAMLLLQLTWPGGLVSQPFRLTAVLPDEAAAAGSPRYVEVGENDTLDAIAIRLSRGSNRSYLHMMYALFRDNPEGFYGGNLNNLKHGVRLRVPSEAELYELSDAEVFGGIREQYAQWQARQPVPNTGGKAGAALSGMSDEEAAVLAASESPEMLQQQLSTLAAEREAIEQRNRELKRRLAQLEQRMQEVSQQVLDYPTGESAAGADSREPASPQAPAEEASQAEAPQVEALPVYLLPLLILLSLGAGILVWRNAKHARREA